jgi:hypothetical protein
VLFVLLPGRQPTNFYICVGRISRAQLEAPLKMNLVLGIVGIASFALHIGISAKISRFRGGPQTLLS